MPRADDFGARYYDSSLGRFLTPDWSEDPTPIPYVDLNNPQTLNLYAYVLNNPATNTDPDGHWCFFGIGTSCSKSAAPTAAGAAAVGTADSLTTVDTQAILSGLKAGADSVVTGSTSIAGAALDAAGGVAGALLTFSEPLNAGEDEILAKDHAEEAADRSNDRSGAQDKKLTAGEIEKLKGQGIDPHDLKPNSKYDLLKDRDGNIVVKPKDGSGPGDPTGININNLPKSGSGGLL